MNPEKLTYQDIARLWSVSVATVKRWVKVLEVQYLINPLRPTDRTVRFTAADCQTLDSIRRMKLAEVKPVRFPAKNPVKKDGKRQRLKKIVRRKGVQKRPKH